MSWASRRRTVYLSGVILFFALISGIPLAMWWYEPATCFDGVQNQDETARDKGGSCQLLDEHLLTPHAILWARAFSVRDGSWSAVAYVENPNDNGGVMAVPYRFKLYDAKNILVTEREGVTFIMPGSITPVYEGSFDTGKRLVAKAFFEFTAPLVWESLQSSTRPLRITGKTFTDAQTMPRVAAFAENTAVSEARDVEFVATVFDPAGNAIASSRTILPLMTPGVRYELVFTWPDPFTVPVGRADVLPLRGPVSTTVAF